MNRIIHLMFVVFIVTSSLISIWGSASAHGSFETPKFRVNWSDRWHEAGRTKTNVVLFDGLTSFTFVAIPDQQDSEESLASLEEEWFTLTSAEEVKLIPSSSFSDESSARAVYSSLERTEADTLEPHAVYLEVRRINLDFVLWIAAKTPWGVFNADSQVFDSALQTFEIAPFTNAGSAHQSFVSSQWRVALASASLLTSDQALGLPSVNGSNWVVVLADVTNWSDTSGTFRANEISLIDQVDDAVYPTATLQSQIVGRALGLGGQIVVEAQIAPMETRRTALAFQIPIDTNTLAFKLGQEVLPLDELLEYNFDASQLPPLSSAPILTQGTVVEIENSSQLLIENGFGDQIEVTLLGATLPALDNCYFRNAMTALVRLPGTPVLLESDPAVLGDGFSYLWMTNTDGTRTLLNQALVAQGAARLSSIPESAVFNLWFEAAESDAIEAASGVWQSC